MTDHGRDEELESDLRRMLADPGYRLPDRLVPLERVHAGAVRRRRQHQALAASLSVLAVVGLGLGIARPWSTGSTEGNGAAAASSTTESVSSSSVSQSVSPSVSEKGSVSPSPSNAVMDPAQVLAGFGKDGVTSVTAISDQDWWVSDVSTVLATSDGGRHFTVASHDIDPAFCQCQFTTVRFVDLEHGTALLRSQDLASTVDGGKNWKQTSVKGASSFFALEAGGTKTTYALQHNADGGIHLWSQVGTGSWADVATLPGATTPGGGDVQLAVQGDKAVVVWRTASAVVSASYASDGKAASPKRVAGCDPSLGLASSSSGLGSVWLTCPSGTADNVLRTTDLGTTWQSVPVAGEASRHMVGAIDQTHAVVTTASGLARLDASGALAASAGVDGVNLARSTYIGFTDASHGFAITEAGQLVRSTDGGRTWAAVAYQ
jgi:photosystem II stability/assembly factor-like uncharacterized protein